MTKNVFLAGATGAIGRPLVRLLVRDGCRVFGLTRSPDRAADLWRAGAIPVIADVFDAAALTAAMRAIKPDVVVHQLTDLPANLDPSAMAEAVQRNARIRREGSAHLVAAANAAGVRHLVAQSIAWAYAPGGEPWDEEAPLDAHAQGARSISVGGVIALERCVLKDTAGAGCVLRYGQLYGPGTGSESPRDKAMPLHVEAAAWAALLAVRQGGTGAFNVAEPNPSLVVERIRALGWSPDLRL
ncbi:NAD(P)-dependent oxidoreductase [Mitsuaria sp. GD03876]|uniref:NAD-dependent epimerase/dehydratase family protein n=1 Tax=Mitsuaria sp. GD03876 TaxID=2975399 RepID=UPI00244C4EA6|nr:NAD(P)-dependent oxidoreductase [Mitsuaria sp. GD03876]MDH0867353.1 NAD(P)-dependent oxidoreductase [Mitsuaria sp. GD03876]